MTTPLQMANAECPNLNPDGSCLGARFSEALEPLPSRPQPKCRLADDKQCKYFEEFVMPMAAIVSDPAKSKSYLEAVAEYKFQHHISGLSRRCPECGGPLPARKRFCADCTSRHRKKTIRNAVRKFRDQPVIS